MMKQKLYLIGKIIYLFFIKQYSKLYYHYTSQVFSMSGHLDLILAVFLLIMCGINYIFILISIKTHHSSISFFYFDCFAVFTLIYFVQLIMYHTLIIPKFVNKTYDVFREEHLMSWENTILCLKIKSHHLKKSSKTKKI